MNKFYTFKVIIIILIISYILPLNSMEKKPYHHIYKNGKLVGFRNLPGVPTWGKKKWPWRKFSEEKKKINTNVPSDYYLKKTGASNVGSPIIYSHLLCCWQYCLFRIFTNTLHYRCGRSLYFLWFHSWILLGFFMV